MENSSKNYQKNIVNDCNHISNREHNFFILKKRKKIRSKKENKMMKPKILPNCSNKINVLNKYFPLTNKKMNVLHNSIRSKVMKKLPPLDVRSNYSYKFKSIDKKNSIDLNLSYKYSSYNKNINLSQLQNSEPDYAKKSKSISHNIQKKSNIFNKNKFLWQSEIYKKNQQNKIVISQNTKKEEKEKKENLHLPKIYYQKLNLNDAFSKFMPEVYQNNFQIESREFLKSQFSEIISIFSKFKNLKEVGRGSYAIAYQAICQQTHQSLILKTFKIKSFIKKTHLNRLMVKLLNFRWRLTF